MSHAPAPQPSAHAQRHAEQRPDDLAVVGPAASITYAQLVGHASRIAGVLTMVKPGDVVGVLLPPQLEAVFIQALWQLAAISCQPPTSGGAPIDWLVALEPHPAVPADRTILIDGPWLAHAAAAEPVDPVPYADDADVCRLIFSSGTTGAPKAVPLSVRNLDYRAQIAPTHWMASTPILCILPLATASGSTAFFTSLVRGETYIVPGTPAENLMLLQRHQVASVKASPAQLEALVKEAEAHPVSLPALRVIQSVGSLLPEALIARLVAAFGVEVVNLYGSSESGVLAIRRDASTDPMDAGEIAHDMTVEIVDDNDAAVSPGTVGAIRSRRPHQTPGYFRDAAATAAHFRDGWFYPGDFGSLTEGRLRLAGRAAELINAGGVKVDPARIDAAALRFAGVTDAAAFSHLDAAGVTRIALAFVGEVDAEAFLTHLRSELGTASPTLMLRVAEIPRTTTGKVRRGDLAAATDIQ